MSQNFARVAIMGGRAASAMQGLVHALRGASADVVIIDDYHAPQSITAEDLAATIPRRRLRFPNQSGRRTWSFVESCWIGGPPTYCYERHPSKAYFRCKQTGAIELRPYHIKP